MCTVPGKFSSGSFLFLVVGCKGKFKKIKERSKNPDFTCLEGCIGSVRRRRKQTGRKTKGEGWLPGVRKKDKVREPAKATVVV